MYLGRIVEQGDVRSVLKNPLHPYTMGLLQSLPSINHDKTRLTAIEGSVPSLTNIPAGCPFHPRCPYAQPGRCDVGSPPPLVDYEGGKKAACLRVVEIWDERFGHANHDQDAGGSA
jgi:oligopeptide/dipeptide ABC transporter ATP-binding protein